MCCIFIRNPFIICLTKVMKITRPIIDPKIIHYNRFLSFRWYSYACCRSSLGQFQTLSPYDVLVTIRESSRGSYKPNYRPSSTNITMNCLWNVPSIRNVTCSHLKSRQRSRIVQHSGSADSAVKASTRNDISMFTLTIVIDLKLT